MNEWLVALLVGLGTMKVIETAKESIPWPLQPWTKSVASMLLAIGGCGLAGIRGADLWWFGIGTAGLSALAHEARSVLSLIGDSFKVSVIQKAGARRR